MDCLIFFPHRALEPYIQHYVYCELGSSGEWSRTSMAPPGCTSLSITCEGKNISIGENGNTAHQYEPVTFVGQTTRFKKLSLFDHLKTFFVIFQPCGAYRLLGIHQGECKNVCINFTDLLGSYARYFNAELAGQKHPADIKSVVEKFFLHRITQIKKQKSWDRLNHVINQIRLNGHNSTSIKRICKQEGYSISRLERHMKQMVGLSPKQYQRIVRFNSVLQYLKGKKPGLNWSHVAGRFGYYDQMHFIKEFKLFYGATPSDYFESDDRFLSSMAFRTEILNVT